MFGESILLPHLVSIVLAMTEHEQKPVMNKYWFFEKPSAGTLSRALAQASKGLSDKVVKWHLDFRLSLRLEFESLSSLCISDEITTHCELGNIFTNRISVLHRLGGGRALGESC